MSGSPSDLDDATGGVLRYPIFGVSHRAKIDTEAEAVLWAAEGLLHRAEDARRRYQELGYPEPTGAPSLGALADCWEARVRRLVAVAGRVDGYLGRGAE